MARITVVKSARKDQGRCRRCGTEINIGDSYQWFANLVGRSSIRKTFCIKCRPRPSEMTTSDKLSQLYGAQETLEETINKSSEIDDLSSALRDAANEAREVAEAYRDSVSNMPENLQSSSQCDEMNEKADNCETWADSLETAADEIDGMQSEPENDDECTECSHPFGEHKDGKKCEHDECDCDEFVLATLEEARTSAGEACDELSI